MLPALVILPILSYFCTQVISSAETSVNSIRSGKPKCLKRECRPVTYTPHHYSSPSYTTHEFCPSSSLRQQSYSYPQHEFYSGPDQQSLPTRATNELSGLLGAGIVNRPQSVSATSGRADFTSRLSSGNEYNWPLPSASALTSLPDTGQDLSQPSNSPNHATQTTTLTRVFSSPPYPANDFSKYQSTATDKIWLPSSGTSYNKPDFSGRYFNQPPAPKTYFDLALAPGTDYKRQPIARNAFNQSSTSTSYLYHAPGTTGWRKEWQQQYTLNTVSPDTFNASSSTDTNARTDFEKRPTIGTNFYQPTVGTYLNQFPVPGTDYNQSPAWSHQSNANLPDKPTASVPTVANSPINPGTNYNQLPTTGSYKSLSIKKAPCIPYVVQKVFKPVYDECIKNVPLIKNVWKSKLEQSTKHIPVKDKLIFQQQEQIVRQVPIVHKVRKTVIECRTRHVPVIRHRTRTIEEPYTEHVAITEKYTRPVIEYVYKRVPVLVRRIQPVIHQRLRHVPVVVTRCRPVIETTITSIPIKQRVLKALVEHKIKPAVFPGTLCPNPTGIVFQESGSAYLKPATNSAPSVSAGVAGSRNESTLNLPAQPKIWPTIYQSQPSSFGPAGLSAPYNSEGIAAYRSKVLPYRHAFGLLPSATEGGSPSIYQPSSYLQTTPKFCPNVCVLQPSYSTPASVPSLYGSEGVPVYRNKKRHYAQDQPRIWPATYESQPPSTGSATYPTPSITIGVAYSSDEPRPYSQPQPRNYPKIRYRHPWRCRYRL